MRTIFQDRTKSILSCTFIVIFGLSLIGSPFPQYLFLQHIPTLIAFVVVPMWDRRWPLSAGAFACLLAMLVIHVIGARYTYSFVPYDTWCQAVTGYQLSEVFDLERNHYDRLAHLCFGLLMIWPCRQFLESYQSFSRRGALLTAVLVVMAASMLYEVVEWLAAIILSKQNAEAYNGQQGDFWDAQKDMALATVGAILASLFQWKSR
ncbi:MAG: DUF2238 domain-containing protein [Gimesia sp.]|nr:DUF2238 domain-containing protein [Gimesia sp.]